jgi:hypothetical protein
LLLPGGRVLAQLLWLLLAAQGLVVVPLRAACLY